MKTPSIKILALFSLNLLFVALFSCEEASKENGDPIENGGIRLKWFGSPEAIGNGIKPFLKPGFNLSDYSEIKDIGNYETEHGIYEYSCSWSKVTPLYPGEYVESVEVKGFPIGWDFNSEREKTNKAELLEDYDGYDEVFDPRLDQTPYKNHLIVLKNKDNAKGDWTFMAFIDPTHHIDGDGQSAIFRGSFSHRKSMDKAEYDIPTDDMAVSIFVKLVEEMPKE